jgi:hypothetical protein
MYTADLSWQSGNYYSMAKAKLWSYQGALISTVALLLAIIDYEANPLLHFTIKGIGGLVWMAWFFLNAPFHRMWLNFAEVIQAEFLLISSVFCIFHEYGANSLNVPVSLLIIYPVSVLSLYHAFNAYT